MKLDKTKVKRILVITLSNIGDIILTTPVIEVLKKEFPESRLDVMVGPNGRDIFSCDKAIEKLIIFDKRVSLFEKAKLALKLRKNKYDLVVDLRNTILPFILGARYRTNSFVKIPDVKMHKKDAHLTKLEALGIDRSNARFYIALKESDKKYVENLLAPLSGKAFVAVSPGAKSHIKRWPIGNYARLCNLIKEKLHYEIVLVGDENDMPLIKKMLKDVDVKTLDLSGKTNIRHLASIIEKSKLLITNDSAPLHLASVVGGPVLVFFGPTDERKYGPSKNTESKVLRKSLDCTPCEVAECSREDYEYDCLGSITVDEAFNAVKELI